MSQPDDEVCSPGVETILRIPLVTPMSEAASTPPLFVAQFTRIFSTEWPRLYRYLDRLTGDPALAEDLAQEAFIRLHRRGALPDTPAAWLVSVAMNLLRNEMSGRRRRGRLLTPGRAERAHADPAPSPDEDLLSQGMRARVRRAINALPERERRMLLLRAEGYSYRDIAKAVEVNETSIGTLLARARALFEQAYSSDPDAS